MVPGFDSFLLAHATKEHLVEPRFYKRVYRSQGWISPVVLVGGTVIGVWFPKTDGGKPVLDVTLFGRVSLSVRHGIEREAEALGRFLGREHVVRFTRAVAL